MKNYIVLKEDIYRHELRKYIRSNPGSEEHDFLISSIKYFEDNLVKLRNKLDDDAIKKRLIENIPKDINEFEDKKKWLQQKFISQVKYIQDQISEKESLLFDYNIRLKRYPKPENKVKNNQEKIWFKVGLLFANGKMDELLEYFNDSVTKTAEHLEKPNYNKYILATKNNYTKTNSDKNIYSKRSKMIEIINYCKKNNIVVTEDFINRIPSE